MLALNFSKAFSTTTTAESMSMPIAITNPPKLIKFKVRSLILIKINATDKLKGKITPTATLALKFPKNKKSVMMIKTTASMRVLETVAMAFCVNSERS